MQNYHVDGTKNVDFEGIRTRLKEFRQSLGLYQKDFAEVLGIETSSYTHIEKGKTNLTLEHLMKLAFSHKVDVMWLLFGQEPTYAVKLNLRTFEDINIQVPAALHADYAKYWPQDQVRSRTRAVQIPGIDNAARTIEISGDSMAPVLENGDWVVATELEDEDKINPSQVYVVVGSDAGLVISYVKKYGEGLLCIPANAAYQNQLVTYTDLKEIWQVEYRLTRNLLPLRFTLDGSQKDL